MTLWSTKASKHQSRVSHPWRFACQHPPPVAYCTPALLTNHKLLSPPQNLFLATSEKRSRRRILVRQQVRYLQVQPFLAPEDDRNEIKAKSGFDGGGWSGCLCDCPLWEDGARCITKGLIWEAFASRYSNLYFFSLSCFLRSIFMQTILSSCFPHSG